MAMGGCVKPRGASAAAHPLLGGLYFTLRLLRFLMRQDAEVSGTTSWCECWCHVVALFCAAGSPCATGRAGVTGMSSAWCGQAAPAMLVAARAGHEFEPKSLASC